MISPLVPNFINSDISLVVALIVGIAFGFILEQAGFSSSKRLAGLFYGYDFVVLRVFFTAAATAMTGLILLSYFGVINLGLIYINPTFIYSALIGGAIMGAGFIIGGFCPGTSVCAAAIGKLDALLFVAGVTFGALIFGEIYPFVKDILTAGSLGDLMVYDALGMSRGFFAFVLVAFAITAFVITSYIENRVNGKAASLLSFKPGKSKAIIGFALIIAFALIFMPDKKSRALTNLSEMNPEMLKSEIEMIDSDELAMSLISECRDIHVIDVRNEENFKRNNVPGAVNIPFNSLSEAEWRTELSKTDRTNIFYGIDSEEALKAAMLSKMLGDNSEAYALNGGFDDFKTTILDIALVDASKIPADKYKFRKNANVKLAEIRKNSAAKPKPKKKEQKISGGC